MLPFAIVKQEDVPGHLDWLHPAERQYYDALRFEKRINDWLLGRWTAKNLVREHWYPLLSLKHFAILPGENRAPYIHIENKRVKAQISISHSYGKAFCVTNDGNGRIGCDMEKIEKRSEYFYRDYFTESERITAGKSKEFLDEAAYFTLCWSAKEALMKAFRKGLSLHPLKIEISNIEISGNIWNQLFITGDHSPDEKVAWWTIDQGFVYVMIEMDQK